MSKILAKIVRIGKEELKNVYDPTCGSGSLLLRVNRELKVGKFYSQELNSTTYNLARMNMLTHEIHYLRFDIKNADTIKESQHMINSLPDNGTMAVVLPYGVLFRGGAEETIRKHLNKG